jgi:flagellar basal-body rod modification protein FlgD
VGQTVTYTATDGTSQTGKVSAVQIDSTNNTSTAVIDGNSVDVGRITQVGSTS